MRRDEPKTMSQERPDMIEASSGNVFADLDLENPEELLAKAELVKRICEIIAERKLTQTKAAVILGIDRPQLAALMRGPAR
jgi:predicted XRE-type DNA-binding protein